MKILHYSLGFPPYARGGLTKYAVDLMEMQIRQGHTVGMLWPGTKSGKKPKIVKRKSVNGIDNFELKNPEYLPQIYGIKDFDSFQIDVDGKEYRKFLMEYKPDVIHAHTIMGMHIQFLEIAKELGIKTVYTSHDRFGICPRTMLFKNGVSCEFNSDCKGCEECCKNALSITKMKILQSSLYRKLKETTLMKKIRSSEKAKLISEEDNKIIVDGGTAEENQYKKLREGYIKYFNLFTTIHFNSTNSKRIFGHYVDVSKDVVCNITHSDIKNNYDKYNKKLEGNHIHMTYMGAIAEFKGFFTLKKVLDKLYENGKTNFTLTIYNDVKNPEEYMKLKPPYKYDELSDVMNSCDMVVAPRDGTFGFTVLEALSYGVPVLVSEEVGAKDLVEDRVTGILCDCNVESIYERLEEILDNPNMVEEMKANIKSRFHVKEIEEHSLEIMNTVYKK